MSVRINFAPTVVPFPTEKGYWIRLVFKGNSIVQGNVMLFDFEHDLVVLMEHQADSKPEVVRKGDEMSLKDGYLVTYTKIDSVTIKKTPPASPGDASDIRVAGDQPG